MFIQAYFEVAAHLIDQYELQMPLHLYLKNYFKNNKKYGSRDRKYIAELVYGFYRVGKGNEHISKPICMMLGSWLGARLPKLFFEKSNAEIATEYDLDLDAKLKWAYEKYGLKILIPFTLSKKISENDFVTNLFSQPLFFIRLRRNKNEILKILTQHKISFEVIAENCIALAASTHLENILAADEYVIQDWASQQVGNYLHPHANEKWWDVCCASGGKSLLLLDKNRRINLSGSDIRSSILKNYHLRMQSYGYGNNYTSFEIDAAQSFSHLESKSFDCILADVPCSGSGTWARSPEQLYFFTQEKLDAYCDTQEKIVQNILQIMKPQSKLYYVTCSVFSQENESILQKIEQLKNVEIRSSQLLQAWHQKGDCLFLSEIIKS